MLAPPRDALQVRPEALRHGLICGWTRQALASSRPERSVSLNEKASSMNITCCSPPSPSAQGSTSSRKFAGGPQPNLIHHERIHSAVVLLICTP